MTEQRSFTIQLAEKRICIKPLYDMIREYCKEYIVSDICENTEKAGGSENEDKTVNPFADLIIQTSPEDIAYVRKRSVGEADQNGQAAEYTDAYLETLAVYRKIAEWMPMYNTLLFHGSVIAVDGKAYLFTAKSGTGKSTHTRLWREYFGERAVMINDDKPLIRITQEGVFAYGTPWDGKHRLSTNISAPLAGICILRRGNDNSIRKITAREACPMLLQQCYRPIDAGVLAVTVMVLEELKKKTNFYELFCNISQEAVEVAYNGMKQE